MVYPLAATGILLLVGGVIPAMRTARLDPTEALRYPWGCGGVSLQRRYLKREWCIRVIEKPIRSEPQENNRYRFWAEVPELEGRFLRVVTLEDRVTIHNAFPDRRFKS